MVGPGITSNPTVPIEPPKMTGRDHIPTWLFHAPLCSRIFCHRFHQFLGASSERQVICKRMSFQFGRRPPASFDPAESIRRKLKHPTKVLLPQPNPLHFSDHRPNGGIFFHVSAPSQSSRTPSPGQSFPLGPLNTPVVDTPGQSVSPACPSAYFCLFLSRKSSTDVFTNRYFPRIMVI